MRVALYSGTFKRDQDGVSKSLYKLTESLLNENAEVGIWSPSITPQNRKGLFLFNIPSIPFPLYTYYRLALPVRRIKRQIVEFKPDLIQVSLPDMVGSYILKFATKKNIPVVISYHTDFPSYLDYFHLRFLLKPGWKYLMWYCTKGDIVYVPTREVAGVLESKGIKNVRIWSRGIDRDMYNPEYRSKDLREKWGAQDGKVILYSGRFVWYKDLDVFLKVYELFKKRDSANVSFVLVGDGPIKKNLKTRMPDAHFPGYLYGKDLSRVYASADIFFFPSTTETFGNVVLEALSSGLPAVVSDVGGCKEVIQRSGGGLIAEAKNPDSFYAHCQKLVEDEDLYDEMRRNGLRFAEEQSWDRINKKLIEEYRKLINEIHLPKV